MLFSIEMPYVDGKRFTSKEGFMNELSMMIDACVHNGGTVFNTYVSADMSCFDITEVNRMED